MSAVPERCALPGCDEPIEQPTDGGPRRKFCTAAHRAAARRLRHEQRITAEVPDQEIPAQPNLAPTPTPRARLTVADRPPRPYDNGPETDRRRQLVADSHAANLERRRRAQRSVGTRRRGIAVLGAASILAAGGGWVVIDKSRAAVPDTAPAATTDVATGTAAWAVRAQQSLASVEAQLDLVNQVQAAWNARPESRSGVVPQPVAELLAHKSRLEQQRAMLESQLSAVKSLENSRAALVSTERQLASVEHALQAIPSGTPLRPEQEQTARQLRAQRDVLVQERAEQQREVQAWDDSVRNAVAKPVPELERVTGPVTDNVIALIDNSDRRSSPPPATEVSSPLPPATNRQEWAQRERQDVNIGAPPNPGTPNWDDLGQRPNPTPSTQAAEQTVDPEVVDAVTRAVRPARQPAAPSPAPRAVTKAGRADPSSQDTVATALRELTADQNAELPGVQNPYFSDFDPTTPGVQNPALEFLRDSQGLPRERTATGASSQPRPASAATATPSPAAKPKAPTTKPTAPSNGAAAALQAKPSPAPAAPRTRTTSGRATSTAATTRTEIAPARPSPASTTSPTTTATPSPVTPSPSATPARTPEPVAT